MIKSVFCGTGPATGGLQDQWKPVSTATQSGVAAAFQPVRRDGDSIAVSKLGRALTGVAADMFALLDKDGKETLENIVKSGAMSAEDVAVGLKTAATAAVFGRYTAERPRTAEDQASQEAFAAARKAEESHVSATMAAHMNYVTAVRNVVDAQRAASGKDEIFVAQDTDETLAAARNSRDQALEATERAKSQSGPSSNEIFARSVERINKDFDSIMTSCAGADWRQRYADLGSKEQQEAKNRLVGLFKTEGGGNQEAETSLDKAVAKYAASFDVPGIGRKGSALETTAREQANALDTGGARDRAGLDHLLNVLKTSASPLSSGTKIDA